MFCDDMLAVDPVTGRVDLAFDGVGLVLDTTPQTALLIEAASVSSSVVLGQDFRMGVWQSLATPYGKRMDAASRGTPINTSNP